MKIWMQKITGKEKEFIGKCYNKLSSNVTDISKREIKKIKKLWQKCDNIDNQIRSLKRLCELVLLCKE